MSSVAIKTVGEQPTPSRLSILSKQVYLKSSSLAIAVGKKYYDNNQYNYRLIILTTFVSLTLVATIVFVFNQFRGIDSQYCECSRISEARGRIINGDFVDSNELRWVAALLIRKKYICSYCLPLAGDRISADDHLIFCFFFCFYFLGETDEDPPKNRTFLGYHNRCGGSVISARYRMLFRKFMSIRLNSIIINLPKQLDTNSFPLLNDHQSRHVVRYGWSRSLLVPHIE